MSDQLSSDSESSTEEARERYLPRPKREGVALCLSGGGSRAALFELGALRRLNELGILGHVDTITSVSGGSILAAHLATVMRPWPAAGEVFEDFDKHVAAPFERFVTRNLRTAPVAERVLLPWNWRRDDTAVTALTRLFEEYLTPLRLVDIERPPRFVFCATDNNFAVNWVMTSRIVGSYQAGFARTPTDWSLARAVAASSCFPPVFQPMNVGIPPSAFRHGRYGRRGETDREEIMKGLSLSDGGLYDNLALEAAWKDHAVVLAVDGGGPLDASTGRSPVWRLKRYTTIMTSQARALRKRWLIASFLDGVMSGVYLGVGSDVASYRKGARGYSEGLVRDVISKVRTDLDRFSGAEVQVLQNHGYLLAEEAAQKHLHDVFPLQAADVQPPYDGLLDDEGKVATALRGSDQTRLPFGRGPWLPYFSFRA